MSEKGFGFIQFFILSLIVGVLVAISIPAYGEYIARKKAGMMLKDVAKLKEAVSDYRSINDKFVSVQNPDNIPKIYNTDNPIEISSVIDKVEVRAVTSDKILVGIIATGSSLSLKSGQYLKLKFYGDWDKEKGITWTCIAKGKVQYAPSVCKPKVK